MGDNSRVVIVGAGFGGLSAAVALSGAPVSVTVIDRQNHHLFQPLLYQVATAGLSPADIAWPIRRILRSQKNARVLMAAVTGVDVGRHEVLLANRRIGYDFLVLATGATHSWFGHDDWAAHAPGLKSIVDATEMRRHILQAFEYAEIEQNRRARQRLLTFVIVGGGPTGVEMAGAVAELAHRALARDFREIDPRQTRIVLVEAAAKLLAPFPDDLSAYAKRALEKLGVEVRLGTAVTQCDAAGVELSGERLEAGTVIWAAGVAASPVAAWLGLPPDRAGRIPVGSRLEIEGRSQEFVIGDAALSLGPDGKPLPGVAAVAKQQGRYVARIIRARIGDGPPPGEFRYRDAGQLATIGRRAAVVDFGRIRVRGRLAWWLWGIAHIYFLINVRSRFSVALQWLWSYVTFDRGARLITRPHDCPGD
jgi:NADH dehydrogenase